MHGPRRRRCGAARGRRRHAGGGAGRVPARGDRCRSRRRRARPAQPGRPAAQLRRGAVRGRGTERERPPGSGHVPRPGLDPAAAVASGRARRGALLRLAAGPPGRARQRPRIVPGRLAARLHRGERPLGRGGRRAARAPPHAAVPRAQDRGADRPRPGERRRPAGAVAGAARTPAAHARDPAGAGVSSVAVIGAAGIIGPAIVATLAEHDAVDEIRCLDRDGDGARAVAERHGGGKATGAALDITDHDAAVAALQGSTLLLNTAAYRINLAAMEVALEAGAHYLDLGGLYHVTREQVKLDLRFRDAGLLAVLGMGSTPGKTNVMAAHAVAGLGGRIDRVVVAAAGRDPDPPSGPLVAPYAMETILDELSMPTPVVRNGEHVFLEPLTDAGTVEFGEPVGAAPTIYTIHSEQATFAESFGARDVSFQLSLNPVFLDKIRLLTQLGLAGTEPVDVRGTPVVPRQVLLALLARLPKASPSHHAFGIHRIEAHGREGGLAIVECVTTAVDRLDFGGGVLSTASPPAVVADMICRGELAVHTGVLPSE